MVFVIFAFLYAVSFAAALFYFGWVIASAWLVGLFIAFYEIFKFCEAVRLSAMDTRVIDEK